MKLSDVPVPTVEQVFRWGATLAAPVLLVGLVLTLAGAGVPAWALWALPLIVAGVLAARLWSPHLERRAGAQGPQPASWRDPDDDHRV